MVEVLDDKALGCFSALQRAEIAEMKDYVALVDSPHGVSVLFNEPKLLKSFLSWFTNRV